jgi:hypothetical protein
MVGEGGSRSRVCVSPTCSVSATGDAPSRSGRSLRCSSDTSLERARRRDCEWSKPSTMLHTTCRGGGGGE